LVLLAALALSSAPTGKEAQAEELARRSIREYEIGHLTQALADAEQAYLLDPRPIILFNLAQCHRALEHWAEAERLYRNFLRREPRAPNRAAVQKLIVEMMARQERNEVVPAAPKPKPSPVVTPPPVKLAEPPPPAAPPQALAPPEPLPEPFGAEAPVHHGHALAFALGGGALVCAGVAVAGLVEVESYNGLVGGLGSPPSYAKYVQAQNAASGAQTWQDVGIALGAVAVLAAVGAALTW
jgi:tetratricopeptide (TPR) repeat protein